MTVRRYDVSAPISKIERTPAGGMRVSANLTRAGVFEYTYGDGSKVREYRPPEEVTNPNSVASMTGAPLTWQHPSEPVSPTNFAALTKGHIHDAVPASDHVEGRVDVNDAACIRAVDAKEAGELSMGYTADFDPTPGVTPDGEKYDGIQRNMRYNHVALLRPGEGRQGPTVALRLDSGVAYASTLRYDSNEDRIPVMIKVKVAGKTYDAGSQEHLDAVDSEIARITKEATDAKTRADAAEAASTPAAIAKATAARVVLVAQARTAMVHAAKRDHAKDPKAFAIAHVKATKYLDAAEDMAATDDDTILRAILAASCPALDTKGMSHEMLLGALSVSAMSGAASSEPLDAAEEEPMLPDAALDPNAPPKIPGYDSKNSIRPKLDAIKDAAPKTPSQEDVLAEQKAKRADAWKPVDRRPYSKTS